MQQAEDYKAFKPNKLYPDPPLNLDKELLELLSKADIAIGRLDSLGDFIPDAGLFVFMYVRKEAVISSQIEGTQATLIDVLEYEAEGGDEEASGVDEVVNYINAMNHGLDEIGSESGLPLSLRLIKDIHRLLLAGVRGENRTPGEFRVSQNWIGGSSPSSAVFVPPAVHDMSEALNDFEKFLTQDEELPVLVRTALLHYQFETIHPFLDGNGRVGRLMVTFYLCHEGVLKHPLLYLSFFLKKNRQDYYALLQNVRDTGDYESWVKFFLRGIIETAEEAVRTARSIIELKNDDRTKLHALGRGMNSGILLHEALFKRPRISVNTAQKLAQLNSYKAAANLVNKFVKLGILSEVSGRERYRTYEYSKYLEILSTR